MLITERYNWWCGSVLGPPCPSMHIDVKPGAGRAAAKRPPAAE